MKTITEIAGGAQALLDISFDLQSCFEEALNEQQKTFIHMLRCIEAHLPLLIRPYAGTGRRPYQNLPFLRSFFAQIYFQIGSVRKLIERLRADPNLRLICGFTAIPGRSSFSRAFCSLAKMGMLSGTLEGLAKETFKGKAVYHVSRDSTAVSAREAVEKKDKKKDEKTPKKRGRPPKTAENKKKCRLIRKSS
jgi:hypothetical protein